MIAAAAPGGLIAGMLVLLLAAGGIGLSRRRQAAVLRELARSWRLNYAAEDLLDLQNRYHALELVQRGHSRHACHLIYGSTEAGLVTLFFHAFDIGFGGLRSRQHWWTAVLETPFLNERWTVQLDKPGPAAGPCLIRADETTRERLHACGIASLIDAASPETRWEARGPLLAVSAPATGERFTPGELLRLLTEASKCLKPHARTAEEGWRSERDMIATEPAAPGLNGEPSRWPTDAV